MGIFPSDTIANGEWGPSLGLYNDEKAAMIYEFPWMVGHIKKDIGEKSVFFDMPAYNSDASKTANYTIGASNMGYIVSKKSFDDPKKQAALIKLLDFITSDEMFVELSKGGMPPAKNITIDKSVLDRCLHARWNIHKTKQHCRNMRIFSQLLKHYQSFLMGLMNYLRCNKCRKIYRERSRNIE